MASSQSIDERLGLAAQNATIDIARAIEDVAKEFASSGGYGSIRMYLARNSTIVQTFRSAASQMTTEAKRYEDQDLVRDLLDTHLSKIVDHALAQCTHHLVAGNLAPHDREVLYTDLRRSMKRIKDVAIRGFAFV